MGDEKLNAERLDIYTEHCDERAKWGEKKNYAHCSEGKRFH